MSATNLVPSTNIRCKTTASLRASATLALRMPARLATRIAQLFSDEPFKVDDLLDVVQSAGGYVYTLRPAAALPHGSYLLCGKPAGDEGGWMRFCYDFEITGG